MIWMMLLNTTRKVLQLMLDNLLNFIKFRRSIRNFKNKKIEKEKIEKIIYKQVDLHKHQLTVKM